MSLAERLSRALGVQQERSSADSTKQDEVKQRRVDEILGRARFMTKHADGIEVLVGVGLSKEDKHTARIDAESILREARQLEVAAAKFGDSKPMHTLKDEELAAIGALGDNSFIGGHLNRDLLIEHDRTHALRQIFAVVPEDNDRFQAWALTEQMALVRGKPRSSAWFDVQERLRQQRLAHKPTMRELK